jgi:uncharacterized protein (UPF0303 family)
VAGAVMSDIPDFTETDCWSIQSAVDERAGKGKVELHPADIDIKLSPDTRPRNVRRCSGASINAASWCSRRARTVSARTFFTKTFGSSAPVSRSSTTQPGLQ